MTERIDLHEPFSDAEQQREAGVLGMYVFLGTEIMLFGGVFAVIFVTRALHPAEFVAASQRLHVFIGALNTGVLLTSSFAVALAVTFAQAAHPRPAVLLISAAAALGLVFLALKAMEYGWEAREGLLPLFSRPETFSGPVEHLFMNIYLVATGLHAVHMTIGIVLLSGIASRLARCPASLPARLPLVKNSGLYWHFVDVVWVFLYPALYLAR